MQPSPQLVIVETLFPSTRTKRSSYVLVLPKQAVETEAVPEEEARAFTLGIGRPQTAAESAAIFVLSHHDDSEQVFHSIRDGILLEAEEVMKRPADEETPSVLMWLVAEA